MKYLIGVLIMTAAIGFSCGPRSAQYVEQELAKLAPVELQVDLGALPESEKKCLTKIVEAAHIIDDLFLLQVKEDNPEIRQEIAATEQQAVLEFFDIMFGPWNRLEEDKPFYGTAEKPAGAAYYPADMSKQEFTEFINANPEKEKDFTSEFTVIRRQDSVLTSIPYHQYYADKVKKVAALLKQAAELTADPTLMNYLKLRAEAFLDDDYFSSDMAWMDIAGDLEIVIGPYEVYEDQLFGYKAAYEAFVCVVDHHESEKLKKVAEYLDELEAQLPIEDQYKNFDRGASSPIKVVQEIFSAGDTKAGIQTTAFNLPNDERVREAKGSKKVMLKNIARAKFDKCWVPIVNTILAEAPLQKVSFDAYFNHVLMHEMSHGLGPGNITLEDGTETTVGKELKDLYPVIEECKADVLGVTTLIYLIDKGVFPADMKSSVYAGYLGGMFRSIRFGIDEAHGGGVAIQFNYLLQSDAFFINKNGKLDLHEEKVLDALNSLATKVLMIEAKGDYQGAKQLVEKYRVKSPEIEKYVDMLKDVPVDIRPSYPVLDTL